MKWLTYLGDRIALDGRDVVVGRDHQCDLRLSEQIASRRHASIINDKGQCILIDHASRNGTYVNGKRVDGTTMLVHEDRIRIGQSELVFLEWTPALATPTEAEHKNDSSLHEHTVASKSGSASHTGASLIYTMLYRYLQQDELDVAKRIVDGLTARITKSSEDGRLETRELHVVAPAIVEYCRCSKDTERLTWLFGIYAKQPLLPRPTTAARMREVACLLGVKDARTIRTWLKRTPDRAMSIRDRNARSELEALLKALLRDASR